MKMRDLLSLAGRYASVALALALAPEAHAQTFPMYVVDYDGNAVVKLDANGNQSIFTKEGLLDQPARLASDLQGNFYVGVEGGDGRVVRVDKNGNQNMFWDVFPVSLAVSKTGTVYVSNLSAEIFKLNPDGTRSTFASVPDASLLLAMATDADGHLWGAEYPGGKLIKFDSVGNRTDYDVRQINYALTLSPDGTLWGIGLDLDAGASTLLKVQAPSSSAPFSYVKYFAPWFTDFGLLFDATGQLWAFDDNRYLGTVSFITTSNGSTVATLTPSSISPNFFVTGAVFSRGYITTGFTMPVANAPAVNSGKAGRTFPLKWTLTNPDGTAVQTLSAVSKIEYESVACDSFAGSQVNSVTAETSGFSSLRLNGNEFQYNWASPSKAGCYKLMVKLDDGVMTLSAYFNLK